VLLKFNDFTLFVSKKRPQISLAVPIYYALHDLLDNAAERKGEFVGLDHDIALAVQEGIKKYDKYYTFMDASDVYYTALVLDPRVKGEMLIQELQADGNSGSLILQDLRSTLHQQYPLIIPNRAPDIARPSPPTYEYEDVVSQMLQRLRPQTQPVQSDIDRYFDSPPVSLHDTKDPYWLFNWWRLHKDEYPQMAAAARDFLAIPASEVAVERSFSSGRDLIGIRRHSMNAATMRMLVLMNDVK
jgi:hypothetical protein